MDARTFLGLQPTSDPGRWRLPVTPGLCSGYGQLFGGCGLAAGLVALEEVTGRPTIWATAQYLRYAPEGTTLDLDATVEVVGHHISQARMIARTGDAEILTVNAAFGERPAGAARTLVPFPDVPPPDACPPRRAADGGRGILSHHLDVRLAQGRQWDELEGAPGSGSVRLWARVIGAREPSAAWLAVAGDMVPSGVADARGTVGGGNSLDNTLRVHRLVPSEWILCDIGIDGLARGFAHGWAHLWAQDGTLMASASQSVIVRSRSSRRRPDPAP